MQRSRLPARTFPLLAYRLPVPLQRFPNWFPILRRRFHDYFLDLLLEQPCGQRSQLFGIAAKHPPLELVLTFDFHVGHNYSLQDRGDCQNTRKSRKTSYVVGWIVGWKKSTNSARVHISFVETH